MSSYLLQFNLKSGGYTLNIVYIDRESGYISRCNVNMNKIQR